MKLHLPKSLFVAVMTVLAVMPALATTTTDDTAKTVTVSGNDASNKDTNLSSLNTSVPAGYTLVFDTTAGNSNNYFGQNQQNYTRDIQIGDGQNDATSGLVITNGYGNTRATFSGTVTGNGLLRKNNGGTGMVLTFSGDVTGYTGNMALNASADWTLAFGNGGAAVATSDTKGASGTGAINFESSSNKLSYNYAASENPVYITNTITKSADTVTSKVEFKGGAAYVLTKNAAIDALTIGGGSSVTINAGVTLAIKTDSTWTTVSETACTTGNGFGTNTILSKDFGSSLVNGGGTITVNGSAKELVDGVLTSAGSSYTYYINDASAAVNLGSATHAVIDTKTTDTAVTFAGGVTSLLDMDIKSGLVQSTNRYTGGTGFVSKGDVTVHGGATLQIAGTENDVLGYGDNRTKSITLIGEKGKTATLDIAQTKGSTTMETDLILKGNALVKSSSNKSLNSFGGSITATGTDNEVSAEIQMRNNLTVNVTNAGDTLTLGKIAKNTNNDGGDNVTLTKTGAGILTIAGDINTRGTIDGANTTVISSRNIQVDNAAKALTLKNVSFSKDLHYINSAVKLAGTIDVQTDSITEVRRAEGNGYGTRAYNNVSFLTGSGQADVTGVTAWKVNGFAAADGASYANGAITATTDSNVYYINESVQNFGLDRDTVMEANDRTVGNFINMNGHALTLSGSSTKLHVLGEGFWGQGTITVENGATLDIRPNENDGLVITDATITMTNNLGHNGADFNGQYQTTHIDGNVAVTGTRVNAYKFDGGTLTINSGEETNVTSDTMAQLVVTGGSTALISGYEVYSTQYHNVHATGITATETDAAVKIKEGISFTIDTKAETTINTLTLNSGSSLTIGTATDHDYDLTTTTLTVAGDSAINANLVVLDGGTMDFSSGAVLTMGCSVEIGEDVKVYITSDEVDAIRLGQTTVTVMDLGVLTDRDTITLGSAQIYVNNVLQSDFRLDTLTTADGKTYVVVAPEPATATLSLLALAGLMARRRRH